MSTYQPGVFVIDTLPGLAFQGYHLGEDWNGWACPSFERAVAEQILEATARNGGAWRYDATRDVFVLAWRTPSGEMNEERFAGQMVVVEGGARKELYPIGARFWIWEEQVDEES